MTCPHCNAELTLEEIKLHITPEEVKKLWASLNGKKMTEARRLANQDRAKSRWAKIHSREVPNAPE
jgi:hypothetical protein